MVLLIKVAELKCIIIKWLSFVGEMQYQVAEFCWEKGASLLHVTCSDQKDILVNY